MFGTCQPTAERAVQSEPAAISSTGPPPTAPLPSVSARTRAIDSLVKTYGSYVDITLIISCACEALRRGGLPPRSTRPRPASANRMYAGAASAVSAGASASASHEKRVGSRTVARSADATTTAGRCAMAAAARTDAITSARSLTIAIGRRSDAAAITSAASVTQQIAATDIIMTPTRPPTGGSGSDESHARAARPYLLYTFASDR